MSAPQPRYAAGPTALLVIGIALIVIVAFKAAVLGFYPSDLAWMAPMLIVGTIAAIVGRKWAERA